MPFAYSVKEPALSRALVCVAISVSATVTVLVMSVPKAYLIHLGGEAAKNNVTAVVPTETPTTVSHHSIIHLGTPDERIKVLEAELAELRRPIVPL